MGSRRTKIAARAAGLAALAALAGIAAGAARAQEVNLGQVSLKRLMDIDVTSVSKSSQRLQDVATSIYVITSEDIRRSGATRLQDLLKMAPGAWISDDSYTVSASAVREYAHPFSSTVLWMLDGVPITNPATGGIFWDVFDLPLADIDRIEVIKGPGGTIYGANAASGIISVYTRDGEASDGLHASLEGGTQGYAAPFLRYGFEPTEDLHVTAWAKLKNHEGYDRNPMFAGDSLWAPHPSGARFRLANQFRPAPDDNQRALSHGARLDMRPQGPWRWTAGFSHSFVRSGKYLIEHHPWPDSNPDPSRTYAHPPADQHPGEDRRNQIIAQARVDRRFREGHDLFVNASHWHHAFRWMAGPGFNMDFEITDLEVQDNVTLLDRHRLGIGANVRLVRYDFTDLEGRPSRMFADPERRVWLVGGFLQDEVALGKRLRLTVGAKAETWTLISPLPEVSPSVRLAFRAAEDLMFWAAASRSVTLPSFSQRDMEFRVQQIPARWYMGGDAAPASSGKWVAILASGEAKPGSYYSVEGGSRGLLGPRLQWDVSAFYSWARDQVTITPFDQNLVVASRVVPGDSVVPLVNGNLWNYEIYGGEALLRAYPLDWLRLELSYSLLTRHENEGLPLPEAHGGGNFPVDKAILEEDSFTPEHVGRLRAYLDLPAGVQFTANLIVSNAFSRGADFNYVQQRPGPIDAVPVGPKSGKTDLDLVLQKAFYRDRITASLWGRNVLAQEPYVEFYNQYVWSSYPHHVHVTYGGGIEYRF